MTLFLLRIAIYTVLPVLFPLALMLLDGSVRSHQRRIELLLIFLFSLGVAGSGIGGWFGHIFLSDLVAESIGWPAGSPFQLEMGFANLALGVLGVVAAWRRDGFREATVLAVTVIGVGATIVHLVDIIETGNLAPGNTLQNVSNLLKPLLLVVLLRASRRAEDRSGTDDPELSLDRWRAPRVQAAGISTGIVSAGFGLGYGIQQPVLGTALGAAVSALLLWRMFVLPRR